MERIEKALNFKVGDYVQLQAFGRRFVGIVRSIPNEKNLDFAVEVRNGSGISNPMEIPSEALITKWQPERGDLCIFWDYDISESIVAIFEYSDMKPYYYSNQEYYQNCIPFISEKQFKEHIGYEEC